MLRKGWEMRPDGALAGLVNLERKSRFDCKSEGRPAMRRRFLRGINVGVELWPMVLILVIWG